MTWVRLADDFSDHPKIVRVGPLAAWLYVCGLTYANRYATDGFLPQEQVRRLADVSEPERLTRRLVEAHLWDEVEGGYAIHDYAVYQPTADEVKQERADAARRQAEYRRRRAEARNTARNGDSHIESDALLTRESQPSRATGAPAPGPARPGPVKSPGPESTSPLPPPPAEGERLTPLTKADAKLWAKARHALKESMSAANWSQLVEPLEPLGRHPDGGLCLRAPPGQSIHTRALNHVRKALLDQGEKAAKQSAIIEA